MQRRTWIAPSLAALAVICGSASDSRAGGNWSVGIGFGAPCYHRHYCAPYYYRPYPLYYYAPPPVVVAPAPVVVQQAPLVQQAPAVVQPPPANETAPPPRVAPQSARQEPPLYQPVSSTQDVSEHLRQLADANEGVRMDSVTQLGRSRAVRAVDPLAATLAGDQSPAVREAAARALGLIGSPKALPALHRAVQVDNDRDVRKAAQFSIEIIQTR